MAEKESIIMKKHAPKKHYNKTLLLAQHYPYRKRVDHPHPLLKIKKQQHYFLYQCPKRKKDR